MSARKLFGGIALMGMLLGMPAHAADAPKDPEVFKIGMITAMSGKFEWAGIMHSSGAQQAVDEINEAGGIDGIKLELVVEDHKATPRDAVTAINKLSSIDGVQAILTAFSPPTLAIAPIADERGILLLNGGGVSQAMVGTFKNLFHNRSLSADLGRGVISYAREQGYKKMAELAWRTDGGESVIEAVEPLWKKDGGEVVATEMMDPNATNIDTQIAKIRASDPDFVGVWAWSPDPGTAVKRFREVGLDAKIIGVEYTEDIQKIAGKALEGYMFVSDYFKPSPEYPWSQKFADRYEEKYGKMPHFYTANYYEGVYVIAELLRRAKAEGGDYYHGDKLAAELRKNPVFDSVYGGKMTFKSDGVAAKRVGLFEVKDGEPAFLKYIEAQ